MQRAGARCTTMPARQASTRAASASSSSRYHAHSSARPPPRASKQTYFVRPTSCARAGHAWDASRVGAAGARVRPPRRAAVPGTYGHRLPAACWAHVRAGAGAAAPAANSYGLLAGAGHERTRPLLGKLIKQQMNPVILCGDAGTRTRRRRDARQYVVHSP
jgi:hypothetical protein